MKIAYCLYGMPRLLEQGHTNIKKFLNNFSDIKFDFFCHAWWDLDKVGKRYGGASWSVNRDAICEPETDKKISKLYNPVDLKVESPKKFENELTSIKKLLAYENISWRNYPSIVSKQEKKFWANQHKNSVYNVLSQLFSRCAVAKMLENNIQEYDFVIFSRYDYLGEIKLDLNEIDMNKLYTGKCGWWRSFSDYVFEDNMLMFHPSKIEFMKVFDNLSRIANEVSLMSELKKYKVPLVMIVEPLLTASYFYNNENTFNEVVYTDLIGYFDKTKKNSGGDNEK